MKSHRFQLLMNAACRLLVVPAFFILLNARGAETNTGSRWLLVFDTSSSMKKVLPGTQSAVKQFFTGAAGGQMRTGDSMGVWLVNQQVMQFPAFTWGTNSPAVMSNIVAFLGRQRYTNTANLAVLGPALGRVVQGSQRLTILIFTDGQNQFAGTPYDDGVNQTFADVVADRKKNQQPIVVALRSQLGKYVGCALGFPPADINYPPFPALPAPPAVVNVVKPASPPASPKPVAHPPAGDAFVMVGDQVVTNFSTNTEVRYVPHPRPVVSNPPSVVTVTNPPAPAPTNVAAAPVVKVETPLPPPTNTTTNPAKPVVVPVVTMPSNPPAMTVVATQAVTQAMSNAAPVTAVTNASNNVVPAKVETADGSGSGKLYVFIGAGVLVVVIGIVVVLRSSRRPQSSLISRSMQDDQRRK